MANRICIGANPTHGIGAFVSKPGKDVLTCSKFDLMFSSNFETLQIISSGVITLPANSALFVDITFPNMGYNPAIIFSNNKYVVKHTYLSTSSARVQRSTDIPSGDSGTASGDVSCSYIVLRTAIP